MKILNEEKRAKIIQYLQNNASDQTLLDAVSDTLDQINRANDSFKRVHEKLDVKAKPAKETQQETPQETTQGPEPVGKAAGRIGAKSLAEIKYALAKGPLAPRDINAAINGKSDNTNALLKLLWQRGVVTWDGTRFDLKN